METLPDLIPPSPPASGNPLPAPTAREALAFLDRTLFLAGHFVEGRIQREDRLPVPPDALREVSEGWHGNPMASASPPPAKTKRSSSGTRGPASNCRRFAAIRTLLPQSHGRQTADGGSVAVRTA